MREIEPVFVLDGFALLAYLNSEPGRERIESLLSMSEKSQARILICIENVGEVLYIVERQRGFSAAQLTVALVDSLPIKLLETSREQVLEVAHIKANHSISYADAFVVAAAQRENAVILTGDPEFKAVESLVRVEWLVR